MGKAANNQHSAALNEINSTLSDVHEVVNFMKDNIVTKEEFSELKDKVTKLSALMVTKDYLDDKLADLRGDLTSTIRNLTGVLKTKGALAEEDMQNIYPVNRPL